MKNLYTVLVIILLLIISFFVGQYIYKIGKVDKQLLALAETVNTTALDNAELATKLTSSSNIKISPNSMLIFKTEYSKCGHTLNKYQTVTQDVVNLTKDELQKKYKDWKIESFSEKEIVLYQKVNESCNEHYVIREKNGNLAIYLLDEKNNEVLKEVTNIPVEYLTDVDLEKLKDGIRVNGWEELNARLEDFE